MAGALSKEFFNLTPAVELFATKELQRMEETLQFEFADALGAAPQCKHRFPSGHNLGKLRRFRLMGAFAIHVSYVVLHRTGLPYWLAGRREAIRD
jgi:hypothetical protein